MTTSQQTDHPFPSGAPPELHSWQEIALPPTERQAYTGKNLGQYYDVRLLECQRCRLAVTIYAQETQTRYNVPPWTKCATVHLSRVHCTNENIETAAGIAYPRYYAVCGFRYQWLTPGNNYTHVLIHEKDWKSQQYGQLPEYHRVNCPDCLEPGGKVE